MTQWLRAPVTLPETPGSIPSTLSLVLFVFFPIPVANTKKAEGSHRVYEAWGPTCSLWSFLWVSRTNEQIEGCPKEPVLPEMRVPDWWIFWCQLAYWNQGVFYFLRLSFRLSSSSSYASLRHNEYLGLEVLSIRNSEHSPWFLQNRIHCGMVLWDLNL